MEEKYYFYDYKYWSLEEISNMYKELSLDKRKLFRDSIAHYTLAEILNNAGYDRRMIHMIWELAGTEVDRMELIGTDCGVPGLYMRGKFNSTLRKLINLSGELVLKNDDIRLDKLTNGELFLNNLVSSTIGLSYGKDSIDDLVLIDCNSLTKEESVAIATNFTRFLKNEELVQFNKNKRLIK